MGNVGNYERIYGVPVKIVRPVRVSGARIPPPPPLNHKSSLFVSHRRSQYLMRLIVSQRSEKL